MSQKEHEQAVYCLVSKYVDVLPPDKELLMHEDPTAEFREICERFDRQHAETRRAILQVLRIPFAPAFIIATIILALAKEGILPQALAGACGALDALWTVCKGFDSMHRHSLAKNAVSSARDHAYRLLAQSTGRDKFVLENLLEEQPDLKRALDQFQEDEERRKLQEAAERIGVCQSSLS